MVKNAKKRVKTKSGKRSVGRAKVQAKRKAKAQAKAVKRVGKGKRKRQMPGAGVQTLVPPTPSVTHEAVTTELRIASEVNMAAGGLPVEAIAEPPATSSGLEPDEELAQLDALDDAERDAEAEAEALAGADDVGYPGNDYR